MLYFSESEFSAEVKVLFGEYMKVYVDVLEAERKAVETFKM